MSVQQILEELPKLSDAERELILRELVRFNEEFEPTPAMEEAIREGMRSIREDRTYSAAEVRFSNRRMVSAVIYSEQALTDLHDVSQHFLIQC